MTEPKDDKSKNIKYEDEEGRTLRRIIPQAVVVVPTVDRLMNDALSIIGSELACYKSKASKGIRLELKEANAVQGYIETLIKLNRETREAARMHDLSNLSDEELSKLAHEVLNRDIKPKVLNAESKNVERSKDQKEE